MPIGPFGSYLNVATFKSAKSCSGGSSCMKPERLGVATVLVMWSSCQDLNIDRCSSELPGYGVLSGSYQREATIDHGNCLRSLEGRQRNIVFRERIPRWVSLSDQFFNVGEWPIPIIRIVLIESKLSRPCDGAFIVVAHAPLGPLPLLFGLIHAVHPFSSVVEQPWHLCVNVRAFVCDEPLSKFGIEFDQRLNDRKSGAQRGHVAR